MNIKSLLLPCSIILLSFSLTSCKDGDVKVVSKVPDGFISFNELDNYADNILRCFLWENNVVFSLEGEDNFPTLYQASIRDSDVIVRYQEEYYINEAKFLELTKIAIIAREERKQEYRLGDKIEILGAGKNYCITITGVEEKKIADKKTLDIKFLLTSDATENDLKSIFSFVEITTGTTKGTGNIFDFIDSETVRFEMKADRKLNAIILKSPDYLGLIYRIVID